MRRFFHKPVTLTLFSIVLSLFTLVAFHKPLLDLVLECVERDFNGWVLVVSIMLLTFVANFMVYYLLLYLCRIVGRIIISILIVANSVALYFVNTYEVLLTRDMMGNLFNTNISEASGFISFTPIIYVTLLGVVPSIYIVRRAVEYGTLKRMFLNVGVSLVAILLV